MWKSILKGRGASRRLDFKFLKRLTILKGREMKGKTLNSDEYMQFQEVIRNVYSTQHTGIPLDRISQKITTILKTNDLLKVKTKKVPVFDADGKEIGKRENRFYHFI
jgi:hypothetical protein|tara:strand:- start:35 stop:355 length:321 start_codon:yes stop_codon:yes gene_type:complete